MNKEQKLMKQVIDSIKNRSDIKTFKVIKQFEDDHLQCAKVEINGCPFNFMYYDSIGFLDYWSDSDRAFNDLKGAMALCLKIDLDC